MKLLLQDDDQVDVRIPLTELVILGNIVREVCHGFTFSDEEFQAIFDVPRTEAETLQRRLNLVLERLRLPTGEA